MYTTPLELITFDTLKSTKQFRYKIYVNIFTLSKYK